LLAGGHLLSLGCTLESFLERQIDGAYIFS
jgi:hypothetical protein